MPNPPEQKRSRKLGRPRSKKSPSSRSLDRNECNSNLHVSVLMKSPFEEGGVPFAPQKVENHPKSNGLVRFKISENWIKFANSKRVDRIVPFIDHRGCIHSVAVATWKCTSQQLLATITSTVFKRLRNGERRKSHKRRAPMDLLFKISLLYTITMDSYWFSRTLEILKRSKKALLSHFYHKLNQVESNKRFLFDQACQNALWLQSRALRPRVISTSDVITKLYLNRKQPLKAPFFSVTVSVNKFLSQWGQGFLVLAERAKTLVDSLPRQVRIF